ncbi:MAG: hypothetical protein AAFY11_05745, partial [Cyanobacteria bacterium J06641_5]
MKAAGPNAVTGITQAPIDAAWQRQLNRLFERLLMARGDRYLPNTALESDLQELASAVAPPAKDPTTQISWQFLQARADYERGDRQAALRHLQSCLEFWQTELGGGHWVRIAVVYEHLGWCYRDEANWVRARHVLDKCLLACERAERTDAALARAGTLASVLAQLQAWGALKQLADRTIHWLGLQPIAAPGMAARILGWQAALALGQAQWREAIQTTQAAFEALATTKKTNTDSGLGHAAGLYHLYLARAHLHLGERNLAQNNWAQAIVLEPEPQESEAYCQEFQNLITALQARGERLTAFELKQALYRYQHRIGQRAFIGATSLPAALNAVAVPGREGELKAAIEQLYVSGRPNKPLLLYGPPKSGKRSLLDAGIVPTLECQGWQVWRVQECQHWATEIGRFLNDSMGCEAIDPPHVLWERWQTLQSSNRQLTVLILDRLETLADWPSLCAFLAQCLQDPNLRVVLSLREATLHRALDALQTVDLADLDRLHYLDYLSADSAKAALKALGANSGASANLVRELRDDRGVVLPLPLQLAGLQLEESGFAPQSAGALLASYLNTVVRDCGPDNADATWLVFSTLIDPTGHSRIRKTKAELAHALELHQVGAS